MYPILATILFTLSLAPSAEAQCLTPRYTEQGTAVESCEEPLSYVKALEADLLGPWQKAHAYQRYDWMIPFWTCIAALEEYKRSPSTEILQLIFDQQCDTF